MEKRGISLIIPDHRGRATLTEPLDSLVEQEFRNFDVQVLDERPESPRNALLREKYPFVRFTAGCEGKSALPLKQRLRSCDGEYILIVNPGVRLGEHLLSTVSRFFSEDPAAHLLSCKVLYEEREHTVYETGFLLSTTGKLVRVAAGWRDTGEAELFFPHVFSPSASAWAFRKSLLEVTGGFTQPFYSYYNAVEVCFRCWKAGYSCRVVPEATAYLREEVPLWEGFREPGLFLTQLERNFQTYFPESFIKSHGRTLHRTFRKEYASMVGGKHAGFFPELKGLSFLWKSIAPEKEKSEAWTRLTPEDVEQLLVSEEELAALTGKLAATQT